MRRSNFLLFALSFLLLTPFIASSLISPTPILNINKTFDQDLSFTVNITNSNSFTLFNISIQNNSDIQMNPITQLNSGQSVLASFKAVGEDNINSNFRIKGFYSAKIGDTNKIYNVNFDKNDVNACVFSVIKNEKVLFNNTDTSIINLINLDTGDTIKAFNPGETLLLNSFTAPGVLNFRVSWFGFTVKDCRITTVDDTGLVTDPSQDLILTFNVNNNYNPTAITVDVAESNFSMDFFDTSTSYFILKNTGGNIAKNVKFVGNSWIKFSVSGRDINHLDLNPGESIPIVFEINPRITDTSQTNKSYILNFSVLGNFPQNDKSITTFVNYADINTLSNSSANQGLIQMIIEFCKNNPDICNTEPQVIYRNLNDTDSTFNATLGQKQLKDLFALMVEGMNQNKLSDNQVKEQFANISTRIDGVELNSNTTSQEVSGLKEKVASVNSVWIFIMIVFGTVIIGYGLITLFFYYRKKNELKVIRKW